MPHAPHTRDSQSPKPRKPRKQADPPRLCHRCRGTGEAACRICNGQGRTLTGRDVHGAPKFARCEGCMGRRNSRCQGCGGTRFA